MTTRAERNICVQVEWGYDLHACAMASRTWARVKSGKLARRVVRYQYEGTLLKSEWFFNSKYKGSLIVTYDDEGVGFEGSLDEASLKRDDIPFTWQEAS